MENFGVVLVICVIVVILFASLIAILSRYRKCPSDKILVIYGKVGTDEFGQPRSAKCIHGGAAFIVPVIQSYQYLDLTPISMNVDLKNALSKQNIRINVPSRFTVGISTEPGVMQNAAERLLGLKLIEIQELARDIIFGQLRLIIATMDIEEINADRDKFLIAISKNVEIELKKIGLRLINVNVTDITDEFKLKCSKKCCYNMKEKPMMEYSKAHDKPIAFIGLLGDEKGGRNNAKCMVDMPYGKHFQPLTAVDSEWEEYFIKKENIKLCKLYYPPYNFKRTGCKGCPYNIELQQSLDTLAQYFPNERKQCEYIWKPVYDEYRRIGYRLKRKGQIKGQMSVFDLMI